MLQELRSIQLFFKLLLNKDQLYRSPAGGGGEQAKITTFEIAQEHQKQILALKGQPPESMPAADPERTGLTHLTQGVREILECLLRRAGAATSPGLPSFCHAHECKSTAAAGLTGTPTARTPLAMVLCLAKEREGRDYGGGKKVNRGGGGCD